METDVDYYRLNGTPQLKRSACPHLNLEESDIKVQTIIDKITWSCFVPHCNNNRFTPDKKVVFFPVPEGTQGMWKSTVTMDQEYSNTASDDEPSFCCEEHFDVSGSY